jgi:hypothetical protein
MNLEHCVAVLERAGVTVESGLTAAEIAAAEAHFDFVFPPDLSAFLAFALPTGKSAPTWRDLANPGLLRQMNWPFEGMRFDIEANNFWPSEWGERPSDLHTAVACQPLVAHAPLTP